MHWLGEILWSVWAGFSTAGSVVFVLAAGLALFGLFLGLPYMARQRRRSRKVERALQSIPPPLREAVLAASHALGGYPSAEAILATVPGLRPHLAVFGVPAEDLVDRLLASDAPEVEEAPDLRDEA